ncbi:MAG: glutamate racemase [Candidatus Eisenbacteria bacterium]|nr:glutamate racemase [Candidatus Eisenbacteria bacterium]
MKTSESRIGVFDSGVGGLTVVRELMRSLPGEGIVYFGDTARVPYGSKSRKAVTRFSVENAKFLLRAGVKMIVVACNTASAFALPVLRKSVPVPVVGVIQPGVFAASKATISGKVGVIGTLGTIGSKAYEKMLRKKNGELSIFSAACPLFVPLAEEGWTDHEVTKAVAEEYLAPLRARGIDTLILGCTHYPLLAGVISEVMGDHIVLIDSGEETAKVVREILRKEGLSRRGTARPANLFCVSDIPARFRDIARRFLGSEVGRVHLVDQSSSTWFREGGRIENSRKKVRRKKSRRSKKDKD